MAALQHLTRVLLAAGGMPDPNNRDGGIFIYNQDSTLVAKTWEGSAWSQDEALVAQDAAPNSPAVYFITAEGAETIFYKTTSNTIKCRKSVEGEWSDDASFKPLATHPDSKFHGVLDPTSGSIQLYFQCDEGKFVQVDSAKSWAESEIPFTPVTGSPITVTSGKEGKVGIFYISSADNYLHVVTGSAGAWKDAIVANVAIPEKLQRMIVAETDGNNAEAYILSEKHTIWQLVTVPGEEEKRLLGKADKDGKFVPGDSAECCPMPWWPPPYTCCRCYCAPCRCCCW